MNFVQIRDSLDSSNAWDFLDEQQTASFQLISRCLIRQQPFLPSFRDLDFACGDFQASPDSRKDNMLTKRHTGIVCTIVLLAAASVTHAQSFSNSPQTLEG